jgi:hypothetical protein
MSKLGMVRIAMREYKNYEPGVLRRILQRKEKELFEGLHSRSYVGSGRLLELDIQIAAIQKLMEGER